MWKNPTYLIMVLINSVVIINWHAIFNILLKLKEKCYARIKRKKM